MKIALIEPRASYFVAGSERISIRHAEYLTLLGHQVMFYTSLPGEKKETPFFKDLKSKKIKNLSILQFNISERLPKLYETEPDGDHIHWVAESLAFNQLIIDELKRSMPDIILTYYLPDSLFKPIGIPNVVYLVGSPLSKITSYKAYVQFCNATISISSLVKEKWKDEISKVPLNYTLGTGVDYPLQSTSIVKSKAKYNLVYVGRLIERKGILILIEALADIIKIHKDIHLWIIGDGELRNLIRSQIKKFKLDNYITTTGLVYNPYDYFLMADICIFPSYQGEGLMGTVLEAMSAGKPVISTVNNGNEDVIKNEENGILIQPRSVKEIVDNVHNLIIDKQKRAYLGKNAKRYIEKEKSWKMHSVKLADILKDVLKNSQNES